jgi:hypothetical protein
LQDLVGAGLGATAIAPLFTVCAATALPPCELKDTVKRIIEKFAVTVALPEVSVTVVESAVGVTMVAVPLVTVQLTKLYPVFAAAVMVAATPWVTVAGDAGEVIDPPVPAVRVN